MVPVSLLTAAAPPSRINGGATVFFNTSTAGSATITNNASGNTSFFDTSNAGSAAITNNNGGTTQFQVTSNAGSAIITNNGGITQFQAASTAGNATHHEQQRQTPFSVFREVPTRPAPATPPSRIIARQYHLLRQYHRRQRHDHKEQRRHHRVRPDTSTAGNATITNNNGTVAFFDQSDGGAAHLINGAGGIIDFSGSSGPNGDGRLSVGSLAGSGTFIVGQQQLVTVTGSLAFTSGALYLVQVSGQNAGLIAVDGAATLAGNVGVDVLSRLTQKTTYTILSSANPLNGTFGSVRLEFANNFARDPTLSYVGNTVLLTLQPGLLSPLLPDQWRLPIRSGSRARSITVCSPATIFQMRSARSSTHRAMPCSTA